MAEFNKNFLRTLKIRLIHIAADETTEFREKQGLFGNFASALEIIRDWFTLIGEIYN